MKTLLIIPFLALASCTVTVSPDGGKSVMVDAEGAAKVIKILNEK